MKTIFDLPDALVNEVRLRARHEGRMLNDAVADLLRKGLAAAEAPPAFGSPLAIKTHPQTGLPYIECPPGAPATSMTTADLVAFEHDTLARHDLERLGLSP